MIAQTIVRLPAPVTLDLRIATRPRPRVVQPGAGESAPAEEHVPEYHVFSSLTLHLVVDAVTRTISAYLPPIPHHLPLYGPEDFVAAAGDSMEDHADRVLQLLGSNPATILQAMIDGTDLPPLLPRVPREIPNWRAKVILSSMGLLPSVEAGIAALPEPEKTVATLAWYGDAKLARTGKTVLSLSSALGLTAEQIDQLFIAAEALEV